MASDRNVLAGNVIRRARLRAGLSQRRLAEKLATSQALVARWESGIVSPAFDTVIKAVRACGFDLSMKLLSYDSSHDHQIDAQLAMPPEERVKVMVQSAENLTHLSRDDRVEHA